MARRTRGAIMRRHAEINLYEVTLERAHKIAQEICNEIAARPEPRITGDLLDGYYVDEDTNGDALIKSRVQYWKFVEYGGGHGDKQPHVAPAIEAVRAVHT